MRLTDRDHGLEAQLLAMVQPSLDGITVEAGYAARWKRKCVLFRWKGFDRLLPEERFQRLCTMIPEDFRESRLAGFVWLELAPDEPVDGFLRLPRSEDVAGREKDLYAELKACGVFEALRTGLGRPLEAHCRGDFAMLERILQGKKYPPTGIRDVKLVCIRHHAFCDCQVVQTALQELGKLYPRIP
jgi:hypothetical protein